MLGTLLDRIYPQALNRGYLLLTQTLETLPLQEVCQVLNWTVICYSQADQICADVRQSVGSHIPPGPQQGLFIANPNSRSTSVEGSFPGTECDSDFLISSLLNMLLDRCSTLFKVTYTFRPSTNSLCHELKL